MILANYINDLLYRYDCVIVPDFGGFVTNRKGASLHKDSHAFYPPSKQITFNSHLKNSDGLLANYIASSENISFEKASTAISLSVIKWQNEIQKKPLEIGNIGVLTLNEQRQIIFEPNYNVNYLSESFGLENVTSSIIERKETLVKPLIPVVKEKEKKGIPTFIKYAATVAILLTLGVMGNNSYQQNKQEEVFANTEKALEKKIQKATFVIANPLPVVELNVAKKVEQPFHVVAGAFQFPENAKKKVAQLKKQGYKARILGVNNWGLTEVVFESFTNKNDAINSLYKIQKTVSKDAWLLIKK
jgi:hypothetical protein